jgi:PQQ-like domain
VSTREQGTIEEEQLSEMLHRLTPEPPRAVTVEDIAIRLANQASPGHTQVLRAGKRGRPRWMPALAAASVVLVVGASAGIAAALTSHHGKPAPASTGGGNSPQSSSASSPVPSTPVSSTPAATHPAEPRIPVANGIWGASLINHQALVSHSLVGSGNSLYAITVDGFLVRFDPASGSILQQASIGMPAVNPPVVAGNTVWLAFPRGSSAVLVDGYNATTLAPAGSITVTAEGQVASSPEGILATGPDGNLYVAAGSSVAVVNPSSGSVIKRIPVGFGPIDSVAVSPDGSKLYVALNHGGGFNLLVYNVATGAALRGSTLGDAGDGGYLLATSGGVWFTTGAAMTQRVSFARGASFGSTITITSGADGGLDSVPTYVNGVVWVGGTQKLECLDPSSGKVRGSAAIPSDAGVTEHFGSIAYAGGHAFATYQDDHAQRAGVAAIIPPGTCAA